MAGPTRRRQLEASLKEAGDAISKRVSRIERVVRPPAVEAGLAAGRKLASDKRVRVAAIVGAGLLVGWLLGGRGAGRRRRKQGWIDDTADDIVRRHQDGLDVREAVERSLRGRGVPASGSDEPGGLIAFLLGYAVRTGVQSMVRSFFSEFSKRRDDSA